MNSISSPGDAKKVERMFLTNISFAKILSLIFYFSFVEISELLSSVNTISLNDVIKDYFNNISPSYISIDTEGSEYEILKSFNFNTFRPKVFTIEHNFTDLQTGINDLMKSNNYERIFNNLTAFDAWYVSKETLKELDF